MHTPLARPGMTVHRCQPEVEFAPAAIGTRVRFMTSFSLVVTVVISAVIVAMMSLERRPPPWPAWLTVLVAPAVVGLVWHGSRVRGYRLTDDMLLVRRPFRDVRVPWAQLQEVHRDPGALGGARKVVSNDGLGAIAGRFTSKRLGRFRVYVTDPEYAVVLRWPAGCLVVSPAQPDRFVETARRHLVSGV